MNTVNPSENAQTLATLAAGQSAKNAQLMMIGIPALLLGGYFISQGQTETGLLVIGAIAAVYIVSQVRGSSGLF